MGYQTTYRHFSPISLLSCGLADPCNPAVSVLLGNVQGQWSPTASQIKYCMTIFQIWSLAVQFQHCFFSIIQCHRGRREIAIASVHAYTNVILAIRLCLCVFYHFSFMHTYLSVIYIANKLHPSYIQFATENDLFIMNLYNSVTQNLISTGNLL